MILMADRKIYQKEQIIRKKITKIENDIGLWKTTWNFSDAPKCRKVQGRV